MADHAIGNVHGLTNPSTDNRSGEFDDDDLDTIATMKAALQAADANAYSDENLNTMTYNDLVFATNNL